MRSAAILALTGGGIMARFSTQVLEDLQERRTAITGTDPALSPICEAFDLMAGTSAGALCVAGLAMGRSPAELSKLFDEHGPKIFQPRRMAHARWLLSAKYRSGPLIDAISDALNAKNPLLGDVPYLVAFPAMNETDGTPVVFTNANPKHLAIPLKDVVMASASAPTYFPAHSIPFLGRRFVDGGLFANAPDLAAITIARRRWPNLGLSDLHILSIGTTRGSPASPYGDGHPGAGGILSWALRPPGRVLKLAMSGQVDHAMALLPELGLADFIRFDQDTEAFNLDDASPATMKALKEAARTSLKAISSQHTTRLRALLGRRRAAMQNGSPVRQ